MLEPEPRGARVPPPRHPPTAVGTATPPPPRRPTVAGTPRPSLAAQLLRAAARTLRSLLGR